MAPLLTIAAFCLPAFVNLPDRTSESVPSVDVATRDPTFTCAFLPNKMPLPLINTTRPFASSVPRIWLAFAPPMRLTAMADELGCTNCVVWPLPTLKLDQLMTTPSLVWSTFVTLVEGVVIEAEPVVTLPSLGFAHAGTDKAGNARTMPAPTPETRSLDQRNEADDFNSARIRAVLRLDISLRRGWASQTAGARRDA